MAINVWPVVIQRTIFLGDLTQVHVDWGSREIVIRQTDAVALAPGSTAYLSIDPEHCVLLEPDAPLASKSGSSLKQKAPLADPMTV